MSKKSEQTEVSFGKWLQEQRTAQRITIEEISARTSIRSTVLEAIEAEAHDQMPAKVYTVSFIRTFALEVGLDPDEVLRRYRLHRDLEIGDKKKPNWGRKYETYADKTKYFRWLFMLLAGVALLLVAWWGYVWLWPQIAERIPSKLKISFFQTENQNPQSVGVPAAVTNLDSATIAEAEKDASTLQPQPSTTESTEVTAKTMPVKPESPLPNRTEPEPADESGPDVETQTPLDIVKTSSGVQLKIVAVATTWMRITRDDDSPQEYTLTTGDQKEIKALSGVNLLIGNAGGVILTVNGQPYPIEGKKGEVVKVSIP